MRGATAAVSMVDESKKSLQLKKIEHFSSFHNFNFEQSGNKIGRGKPLFYDTVYVEHQRATDLQTEDATKSFFEPTKERELNPKEKDFCSNRVPAPEGSPTLFDYSFPGCTQALDLFSDLELRLDVGTPQILYNGRRVKAYTTTSEKMGSEICLCGCSPQKVHCNFDGFFC